MHAIEFINVIIVVPIVFVQRIGIHVVDVWFSSDALFFIIFFCYLQIDTMGEGKCFINYDDAASFEYILLLLRPPFA